MRKHVVSNSPSPADNELNTDNAQLQTAASGDWCIWMYIFYPVLFMGVAFSSTLLDNVPDTTTFILGIVLLSIDRKMLLNRGITPPHWGWIILGLPYLWKRCNILKKSKTPFWLATIVLSVQITLACVLIPMMIAEYDSANEYLPAMATTLLKDPSTPEPYQGAKCIRLTDLDDFYEGKLICELDNGKKIQLFLTTLNDGESHMTWSPYTPNGLSKK